MKLITMPGMLLRAAKNDVKRARTQWPQGVALCVMLVALILVLA